MTALRGKWWSEVRYVGDTFAWTVWKDGKGRPTAPQLVIQDSTYSSGLIGVSASVFTNNISAPMPTDATFDDFFFASIPERPSAAIGLLATGAAAAVWAAAGMHRKNSPRN